MPQGVIKNLALAQQLVDVLDVLAGGVHAGQRAAHAKGLMCAGTFAPTPEAAKLTRAPHANRASTPVLVRFSDGTGVPNIPDNNPLAGPRGMAVRFELGDHRHTDIIAHAFDGFPVRTGEEFLELLRGAAAAAGGNPQAIGAFMATHPAARKFAEAPKPIPASFLRDNYFAVNAFKFVNAQHATRFGRFRLRPDAGVEHLTAEAAAAKSPNFLVDEVAASLARKPATFGLFVQLADAGDNVTDATAPWPASRQEVRLGTITLTQRVDDQSPDRRRVIFDPDPRIDGIEPSGDPLTDIRSDVYLLSGRRRRAALGDDKR